MLKHCLLSHVILYIFKNNNCMKVYVLKQNIGYNSLWDEYISRVSNVYSTLDAARKAKQDILNIDNKFGEDLDLFIEEFEVIA